MKSVISACVTWIGLAAALLVPAIAQASPQTGQVSAASESGATAPQTLQLKDGTPVRLRTKEKISSLTAKADDGVAFTVEGDVMVGDLIVIRRGAPAMGRVISSQPSRHMGRAGELNIEITSVQLLTGESVPLRASERIMAEGRSGNPGNAVQDGTSQNASGFLVAPGSAPFVKGDNAEILPDTMFTAYVNEDIALEPAKLRKIQPLWQLQDGMAVRLRTVEKITSGKARPGDKIALRVAGDVMVGNLVVIRKGASATGRVASVQNNRSMGRGGILAIELDSVETLAGQTVPVRASKEIQGRGHEGEIGNAMIGFAANTAGVGLLAAPVFFLLNGESAEIPPNSTLTAYVNGDMAIELEKLRSLQTPPEVATGPATVFIYRYEVPRGRTPPVYCGSVLITKLRGKHYVQVRVPPGEYVIQSTDPKRTVKLKAEPGQTYYLHLTLAWSFRIPAPGQLELVDPDKGDDALAFRWWIVDPAVDLTTADPAKLADINPPPKEEVRKEDASGPPTN